MVSQSNNVFPCGALSIAVPFTLLLFYLGMSWNSAYASRIFWFGLVAARFMGLSPSSHVMAPVESLEDQFVCWRDFSVKCHVTGREDVQKKSWTQCT